MASNGVSAIGAPRFPETDAPQTGADYEEVADFAAFRGTRMLGTDIEMGAFHADGFARSGDRWWNTTKSAEYQYTTVWVPVTKTVGGVALVATNASGIATVTHGLGRSPVSVVGSITSDSPTIATMLKLYSAPESHTPTTFQVVIIRTDTNAAFASGTVRFTWMATG